MTQKRLSEATKKRLKAGRMLLAGQGCADVAKAVGVWHGKPYIRGKGCWMKAASMPCAPFRNGAAQPNSMSSSWRRCEQLSCVVRPSMDLAPSYGPSSAWAPSSSACMECASGKHRSGESWVRWASVRRNLRSAPSNATKTLCAIGSGTLSLVLKKSSARRPSDRLCRRVRHQRTSNPSAHVGTQGTNAHHSVSLQPRFSIRTLRRRINWRKCGGQIKGC